MDGVGVGVGAAAAQTAKQGLSDCLPPAIQWRSALVPGVQVSVMAPEAMPAAGSERSVRCKAHTLCDAAAELPVAVALTAGSQGDSSMLALVSVKG